jgi:hypothetical protein
MEHLRFGSGHLVAWLEIEKASHGGHRGRRGELVRSVFWRRAYWWRGRNLREHRTEVTEGHGGRRGELVRSGFGGGRIGGVAGI